MNARRACVTISPPDFYGGFRLYVTLHSYTIGSGSQVDLAREADGFVTEVASIKAIPAYNQIDTREGIDDCTRRAARFVEQRLGGFQLSDVEVKEGQVLASQMSFAAEAAPASA